MAQDKVYSVITDRIIAMLDKGVIPWRRPWSTAGIGGEPVNSRGRSYRGLNRLVLSAVAMFEISCPSAEVSTNNPSSSAACGTAIAATPSSSRVCRTSGS